MTRNEMTCDLCPASAQSDQAHAQGFVSTTFRGGLGGQASIIHAVTGQTAPSLDLCPACVSATTNFLVSRKTGAANPSPLPGQPAAPHPDPTPSTPPLPGLEPAAMSTTEAHA